MFKSIVVAHKTVRGVKRGRPFTRFVCASCGRGCRTEQGLKAHQTRMHKGKGQGEAPKASKPHSSQASSFVDQLREQRAILAANIERLQEEIKEIEIAIDVCSRHLANLKGE